MLDEKTLILASEDGIEKVTLDFYFSERVKILNFQELYQNNIKYSEIQNQLLFFVKTISRIIFACAEGVYRFDELTLSSESCTVNAFIK